jgi:hypothetical protein
MSGTVFRVSSYPHLDCLQLALTDGSMCWLLYGNNYDKFQGAVESVSDLQEQARLWRAQGPIGMVAQIVRWVNKSPGRVKRFEEAQERVWNRDNPGTTQKCVLLRLHMDNSTR